jgi:hypothetical protein
MIKILNLSIKYIYYFNKSIYLSMSGFQLCSQRYRNQDNSMIDNTREPVSFRSSLFGSIDFTSVTSNHKQTQFESNQIKSNSLESDSLDSDSLGSNQTKSVSLGSNQINSDSLGSVYK